jgi:hypothetical protein
MEFAPSELYWDQLSVVGRCLHECHYVPVELERQRLALIESVGSHVNAPSVTDSYRRQDWIVDRLVPPIDAQILRPLVRLQEA